jgi:hypothetical protein
MSPRVVIASADKKNTKVYLACGNRNDSLPHFSARRVAPRTCLYDRKALEPFRGRLVGIGHVRVEFRKLRWRHWGAGKATARGEYAVDGYGWSRVELTAYRKHSYCKCRPFSIGGMFYTRLGVTDLGPAFIGPARGFILDTSPVI